jgi:hypothetical protein
MEILEVFFFFILIGVTFLALFLYFTFLSLMWKSETVARLKKALLNNPELWGSYEAVLFVKKYKTSSDKSKWGVEDDKSRRRGRNKLS